MFKRLPRLGALLVAAALATFTLPGTAGASPGTAAPAGLTTVELSFVTGDGQRLAATLYTPRDADGPFPGLVLVAGSGAAPRQELVPEAQAFARQGIAVLAYDKRYTGYSETRRDYSQLADDAVAAYRMMLLRPEVDPQHLGFWGISEGGWVAPMAAVRAQAAFLVAASAPGLAPLRTQNWNMRNKVARAGVTGSLATTLTSRAHRLSADAGLFAEPYFNPRPALGQLRQPVLAVYGSADDQVPAAESARVFQQNVPGPLTVRVLAGAGHALHLRDGDGDYTDALVPGYADLVGAWVRAVGAGQPPVPFADPLPAQPIASVELTPSATWEGWQAQLAVVALLLVAFLSYPVGGVIRRLRRRHGAVERPARVVSAAGLATVLGFVAYLLFVESSTNWKGVSVGPVVAGRPLVWLALQAAALITVIAGAMTARCWWRGGDRLRHGLLTVGAITLLPWALYWGLLLP